ncbi:YdcF family protein [Thermodesulfobacteriota bacterium]
MFILKKAVIPFILPPGIFMVILFASGIWFFFKKFWKAALFNLLLACLMWFISISPVKNYLIRGLVADYTDLKFPNGDVIILLGGGADDKAQDLSGTGVPSDGMHVRIVTAVRLYKKLKIPIIVSGGKVFDMKQSEADIAMRFLVDLGVPPEKIVAEDKSRDTFENATLSKKICEKKGYKRPIVVTSAYHLKRAVMTFEKSGLNVVPFPAGMPSWKDKNYIWLDYLPGNFRDVSIILKEYLGIVFYHIAYL